MSSSASAGTADAAAASAGTADAAAAAAVPSSATLPASAETVDAAAAAAVPSVNENKLIIVTSDGHTFEVEENVAKLSLTIQRMVEDCPDSANYPVPNVTAPIMAKVIEYCKRHLGDDNKPEDLKAFDAEFVKVDMRTLFELIQAANYLDINGLLGLIAQTIADLIKDMQVEEVRRLFHIENDYTPEEEAAVRKENEWAFQ